MPEPQSAAWEGRRPNGPSVARPVMVGVAGERASGRTTFTCGLVAALGAGAVTSVGVDDYHWAGGVGPEAPAQFAHPASPYLRVVAQHLRLLSLGQAILKPAGDQLALARVEPRRYVIAEGLVPYCTSAARACFDLTVYLDPAEAVHRRWGGRPAGTGGWPGGGHGSGSGVGEGGEGGVTALVRHQLAAADVVVRFGPGPGEGPDGPLSVVVLLRTAVPGPNLASILPGDAVSAVHLMLTRDEGGTPVDAVWVGVGVSAQVAAPIEEAIWRAVGLGSGPVPVGLGELGDGSVSHALAIAQLVVLYQLCRTHH